jgi:hypothetical protein
MKVNTPVFVTPELFFADAGKIRDFIVHKFAAFNK